MNNLQECNYLNMVERDDLRLWVSSIEEDVKIIKKMKNYSIFKNVINYSILFNSFIQIFN